MVLKWIGSWFGGIALLCCLAATAYPQGEGGGLGALPKGSTGKFGAGPAPALPDPLPDPETLKLPGTVNQLIVGGAGKYLLAFVPSEQKLAVVDVAGAKLLKEIPLGSDKAVIAANAEKFFGPVPLPCWRLRPASRVFA